MITLLFGTYWSNTWQDDTGNTGYIINCGGVRIFLNYNTRKIHVYANVNKTWDGYSI